MLKLDIVTPEKRVFDGEVDSVTVPTASGELGILPNHAPLISAVKPGILSFSAKDSSERLVVSSGFVEVGTDKVSILVDTAESTGDISLDSAKHDRDAAEKQLADLGQVSIDDSAEAREALEHASARVALASGK